MQPPTSLVLDANTPPCLEFEAGKIINVIKPEGWSSFDVVKKIRAHIGTKKVGHAGSLDPFASGVLLICTGKATKRVEELMRLEKEYVACIELGRTTDTYDRTGKIVRCTDPNEVKHSEVLEACAGFQGRLWQTPPMYSAIKMNGKRLYELARQGKTIERPPREVTIHEIEVLDFSLPFIQVKVVCSKGTYIRSLAFDLGEKLGCGAHLKELTRTRIGSYKIDNAYSIADFIEKHRILSHTT